MKQQSRHVGGVARVLTYKYVDEGLKKLAAEQELEILEKQRAAEEEKRLAEEKKRLVEEKMRLAEENKTLREALDKQ